MPDASLVRLDSLASLRNEKVTAAKDPSKPYVGLEHLPSSGSSLLGAAESGQSISTNNVFRQGDVLFGKLRPRLRKSVRVLFDGYCSTDILVLRPTANADPGFAGFVLQSDAVFREAIRTEEGTKMPRCSWSTLRKLRVFCPESSQQRRIAEVLSSVDEAIEQTEALIAKTRQIKAGLMHDLFTRGVTADGQLRPPRVEAPQLYKESPVGWIPKEWEIEPLGHILRRHGGYLQTGPFGSQLHADEYQSEGVPVVMPQDINDGRIAQTNIARISEDRANDLIRYRMRPGDIVIARRGELSRAAAISEAEQYWLCGTGCFLLRLGNSDLRTEFASYIYRQNFVQRQIAGRAVGTTMPSLNNFVMSKLWFPFCEPGEQLRIVERLEAVEQQRWALDTDLKIGRQVKSGLMRDLLTGCVRVATNATIGLPEVTTNV